MKKIDEHKKRVILISIGVILLILLYALKNTSYFTRVATFIFSIALFYFTDNFFKLDFKMRHYILVTIIATTGILLSPLYFLYSGYDKILHFVSPLLMSFLVFFLVNKTKVKFSTKLLITFSVVVMLITMFEIIEYAVDQFFNFQLQGVFKRDYSGLVKLNIIMNKNDDTMMDLILGSIGTLFFAGGRIIESYYKKLMKKK